ncbi:four helix bundle protein [Candidatus Uhrbacteria bacterium]|nr:four helix bundle protein [Candidatus Uhrbacteria bacterium]MBD3284232.1 four helix bundle protein [Candidatus Uhrbacteria bacterium]
MKSHKELHAWQVGFELAQEIYHLTGRFSQQDRYDYASQRRRASLSIPSNIAEGYRKRTKADYRHYCHIAFGSASELETQLELTKKLALTDPEYFQRSQQLVDRVLRLLHGLTTSLK